MWRTIMRLPRALQWLWVVPVVFAAGCASENKGKIEGTRWRSYAATVKGQSVADGALKLQFQADGAVVYSAGGHAFTGTYRLGSGKTVVMNMDQEIAGRKTHSETVEIRGGKLTMTDSDGTALTFYQEKDK
jgi:hypothetical protein